MKTIVLIAAALGVTLLGGCTSYPGGGYGYGYGYYYEPWDGYYDGGNGGRGPASKFSGGGRSEPGNEAGMTPGPARPGATGGGPRGGEAGGASGGGSRGGEAGSR